MKIDEERSNMIKHCRLVDEPCSSSELVEAISEHSPLVSHKREKVAVVSNSQ